LVKRVENIGWVFTGAFQMPQIEKLQTGAKPGETILKVVEKWAAT